MHQGDEEVARHLVIGDVARRTMTGDDERSTHPYGEGGPMPSQHAATDDRAATSQQAALSIRHERRPGDLGRVISLHAELYAREYGFGIGFETYAVETVAEYLQRDRPDRDRVWIAEMAGRMVGCIGILGREDGEAQLRWFLVDPATRGQGLGRRLVSEALDFCRAAGYRSVYLWTVNGLEAAARLYLDAGFQKTETKPEALLWGVPLSEERYDLTL